MNPEEGTNLLELYNQSIVYYSFSSGQCTYTSANANICLHSLFQWQSQRKNRIRLSCTENPENDRVRVEDLYAKPYSDDHPDNPEISLFAYLIV